MSNPVAHSNAATFGNVRHVRALKMLAKENPKNESVNVNQEAYRTRRSCSACGGLILRVGAGNGILLPAR